MNPQYFSLRLRTRCREPSRPRTAFGALERLLIPATRDLRATPALPRMAQASRCVDQKPLSVLTCAYRAGDRLELLVVGQHQREIAPQLPELVRQQQIVETVRRLA